MKKDEIDSQTPASMGYRMPAEWERHEATWLAWPHNKEDWPGKFGPIPWIIAEIVRHICSAETVHLLVQNKKEQREAQAVLEKAHVNLARVRFHILPTDRIWTRDSGPIFIKNKRSAREKLLAVGWQFNAWAKYSDYRRDEKLPRFTANFLGLPIREPRVRDQEGKLRRMVLEGGSIDVNGAGCLMTTEECLLSRIQARNPGISKATIEKTLCDYLGVKKILWLGEGIVGDDTHGHIDDTARFTDTRTVIACREQNKRDANHRRLEENIHRLKRMSDQNGRPLRVVELPMPIPVIFDGQRLPASYANFYICNAGVLVPVFNDPADLRALKVLEECFKGRRIIPIYCRDLVWGLGTLHCMTQQQPAKNL
ncbi:MAG TPA: agmatine deiminase family protein [Phycisphaerae bacterium]|nr:agmatine deiminase family protein [Phycisphaerae bacterium]